MTAQGGTVKNKTQEFDVTLYDSNCSEAGAQKQDGSFLLQVSYVWLTY